jgi:hypothetical protein
MSGALTGRLSCGHSETGQTNRLKKNLDGSAVIARFQNLRDSTAVTSAPISETDVHCAHHHAICYVQSNLISDGFLKLESR